MTTERSLSDAEDNAEQEVRIAVIVTDAGFADDPGSRQPTPLNSALNGCLALLRCTWGDQGKQMRSPNGPW
jgi:hypothetical protein